MSSQLPLRDIKSGHYQDDARAYKRKYAEALDQKDPLRHFRDHFIIPSKKDLTRKQLAVTEGFVAPALRLLFPFPSWCRSYT